MTFSIHPLHEAAIREILTWNYEAPYDFYNPTADEGVIEHFLDPENCYFAILNEHGNLVGYCCYGAEARVPNGDYSAPALDIGIGMHPDWTGKGYGSPAIRAILEYGRIHFQPTHFRATVAAWNQRSQRVCLQQGFREIARFHNPAGVEFVLLWREA